MNPTSEAGKKPNRLINEQSPYLLQHAYNPVDWFPWCSKAFERAKIEDKPVFVSIGYSSCHWCHVMEKESFEDRQVAELLNRAFICVKVDREERPDIDAAYMAVCQAMGRNCGWPLNVILTPTKNPFFVASYIPKSSQYGGIGLVDLIPQIEQVWQNRKTELELMGENIKEKIDSHFLVEQATQLGQADLDAAYDQLYLSFDPENGGFGSAPKFPSPHKLLFLLRYYIKSKEKNAWTMIEKTLNKMSIGGIFDHLGGGFHRYSTDSEWIVPHFEKMLYDQALMTLALLEAFKLSGELKFKKIAQETLDYVLRELCSEEGVFFSAEDADSEGEEGKFYLWSIMELEQVLPSELRDIAVKLFNIKQGGNYYEPRRGDTGKNILYVPFSVEKVASELDLTIDETTQKLEAIKRLLYCRREQRVRPFKDDKVLVDWNGLMIAALSKASYVLNEKKYLKAAIKAADFILKQLLTEDNKLFHCYVKGQKTASAFLDDYAFLAWGLIELYEACFDEKYLLASSALTERLISDFWDEKKGGFYFTDNLSDKSIPRIKQVYDGAYPSGNSVALLNLLRLSLLMENEKLERYANDLVRTFSYEVKANPAAYTFLLIALDFSVGPNYKIVLVGKLNEKDTQNMIYTIRQAPVFNIALKVQKDEESSVAYKRINGKAAVYVCRDKTCMKPTSDINQLTKILSALE